MNTKAPKGRKKTIVVPVTISEDRRRGGGVSLYLHFEFGAGLFGRGMVAAEPMDDAVGRFLDACVAPDRSGRVPARTLHRAYLAWAQVKAVPELSEKGLANALKERGFQSLKSNGMWWCGMSLTNAASNPAHGAALRRATRPRSPSVGDR